MRIIIGTFYFLISFVILGLATVSFARSSKSLIAPPKTDYCEMLQRDIQGEHYGFIAGNKLYYIAGSFGAY